jgi:hypothetical protein
MHNLIDNLARFDRAAFIVLAAIALGCSAIFMASTAVAFIVGSVKTVLGRKKANK